MLQSTGLGFELRFESIDAIVRLTSFATADGQHRRELILPL
jgi:hypothetical protein